MNSRDRFINTIAYQQVDRPPLFEDGIREEVLRTWRTQGLGKRDNLESLFTFDPREEIEPLLEPFPAPAYWPKTLRGLKTLRKYFNEEDPERFPKDWAEKINTWKNSDHPLILRLHRGYFLSMGVHGWQRFTDAIELLKDDPLLVSEWMNMVADFSIRLAEKMLGQVQVDAVLFSEPIGGNHGPLISPSMYQTYVMQSYRPIIKILKQHGVNTFIYRTYANTRLLLPCAVEAGFNCLWACECNPEAVDYTQIRREFGKELILIGGIDADSLRQGQLEISRAIIDTVPALLGDGGYIPLADGRVREDVSFENYIYYRKTLEQVCSKS